MVVVVLVVVFLIGIRVRVRIRICIRICIRDRDRVIYVVVEKSLYEGRSFVVGVVVVVVL